MVDQDCPVAVVAHSLLDRLTALRGMMLTARSQLGPGHLDGPIDELLRAADLNVVRMTVDLERLARGLSPLPVIVVSGSDDAGVDGTDERAHAAEGVSG